MTPQRFLTLVQMQDAAARITEQEVEGDYVNVVITLTGGGTLCYLIDVSYDEPQDLVIEAQDVEAASTNSFQVDDPEDEDEMTEIIRDGIRWAAPWPTEP